MTDDLVEQFNSGAEARQDFARELEMLTRRLLEDRGIEVYQVEARTKALSSFLEKIGRKGEKYEDPLSEMTDLVGIRIITYYIEDVDTVGHMIREEFAVDEANSVDKNAHSPDQFGYGSVHYVVGLDESRRSLREWSTFADLVAEVQVRSALQHTWAIVDHKLRYKRKSEVPTGLQRRLFRLSALFELADEQFSDLRSAANAVRADYSNKVRRGDLELALDSDSLRAYLDASADIRGAVGVAREENWQILDDPSDEPLRARDARDLLELLERKGVLTVSQLDALLERGSARLADCVRALTGSLNEDERSDTPEGLITMVAMLAAGVEPKALDPPYRDRAVQQYARAQVILDETESLQKAQVLDRET